MYLRALICLAIAGLFATSAWAQSVTLDKIRKTGVITMGYVEGSAPFSSKDAAGQPQGYSVALCNEIAAGIRAQLKLPQLETRWVALTIQDRLNAVRSGRVDIECSTTTWTLSRSAEVDFSLVTFVDGGSIMTPVSSELRRLADFDGKRIAVIAGTTTEKVLRQAISQRGIKVAMEIVNNRDAGLKMLEQRKVDGFASDRIVLIGMVLGGDKSKGVYKLLDEDFSVEPYAFALPRGDSDYRLAVNRVLANLYRSGGIDKIYAQWLGALGPPSLLLSAAYFVQALSE
jgi:polar amino acid transport system substrate-binding protein/glutamate/aspartate transport system substrate-binding protein